jgi:hypothetical protein
MYNDKSIRLLILFTVIVAATCFANDKILKSNPDAYYLDPDEIRPIVLNDLIKVVELNSRPYAPFEKIDSKEIRLLDGCFAIRQLDGSVAGYYYFASVIPGPLPTIAEILKAAVESGENRYNAVTEGGLRDNPEEMFRRYFPYQLTTVNAFVGVGGSTVGYDRGPGVPYFVLDLWFAKEAAVSYFGNDNVEFKGLVYFPNGFAYEYAAGGKSILIPYPDGRLDPDSIVTRESAESNEAFYKRRKADDIYLTPWVQEWKERLANNSTQGKLIKDSLSGYDIEGLGPWYYLNQRYYEDQTPGGHRDKKWVNGWAYPSNNQNPPNYPLLIERGIFENRQYNLFGTCGSIALASCLAHKEGCTRNPLLNKNSCELTLVPGYGGGSYKYPPMRRLEKNLITFTNNERPCNYAAYMALLTGAIYQHLSGFSFFNRGQGSLTGGNMTFEAAVAACDSAIRDFGCSASSGYDARFLSVSSPSDIICYIDYNNPVGLNRYEDGYYHTYLVVGYDGYADNMDTLANVHVWDWRNGSWPNSVGSNIMPYSGFVDTYAMTVAKPQNSTDSYVGLLVASKTNRNAIVKWRNDPGTEYYIAYYNLLNAADGNHPVNNKPIRPTASRDDTGYLFKLPKNVNPEDVVLEVRLKNGKTAVYSIPMEAEEQ